MINKQMTKVLVIIDIDGLYYHSSKETLEDSIRIFDEKFQNILDQTKADYYIAFCSNKPYFRHKIDPGYKSSRKEKSPLKWLKTLRAYSIEKYGVQSMKDVEADDLVKYWYNKGFYLYNEGKKVCSGRGVIDKTKYSKLTITLCTPDKDLLYNIPGKHFNYTYKVKDEFKDLPKHKRVEEHFNKGFWVETAEEEANYFKLKQLIVGDKSDTIITPFPESAGDWFVKNKMNFNDVVSAYILGFNYETKTGMKKYVKGMGTTVGLLELAKNYRLLHMLDCDGDFLREVSILPNFPTITEVIRDSQIENEQIEF